MSDNPNVFADLHRAETSGTQVEPGDVAVLLKKDGSVHALNFGYDATRLLGPASEMTEEDRQMQLQGQKLFALALAAQHPVLMELLMNVATDPEVVDMDKLRQLMRPH